MSGHAEWMMSRRPTPPADLAAALRAGDAGGELDVALSDLARSRLAEARSRPGRVRASAFRLLEADALITYACEAALDAEDPEGALRRVLASTSA
jgi:hypothetical protein